MKRYTTSKTLLAGAALAGIISGGFVTSVSAATVAKADKAGVSAGVLVEKEKGETHDCAGKNSCKGKGRAMPRRQRSIAGLPKLAPLAACWNSQTSALA